MPKMPTSLPRVENIMLFYKRYPSEICTMKRFGKGLEAAAKIAANSLHERYICCIDESLQIQCSQHQAPLNQLLELVTTRNMNIQRHHCKQSRLSWSWQPGTEPAQRQWTTNPSGQLVEGIVCEP